MSAFTIAKTINSLSVFADFSAGGPACSPERRPSFGYPKGLPSHQRPTGAAIPRLLAQSRSVASRRRRRIIHCVSACATNGAE